MNTKHMRIETVTIWADEWTEYQRLKAAVPDLLAACKLIVDCDNIGYSLPAAACNPNSAYSIAMRSVVAALAKAEGK